MKYIALTIGPIYKTLQNAKKPKELWSGSYFFSYVMKEIISRFRDRTFVTPYIEDPSVFEERDVGLFHDRFIFEVKDGDKEKLESVLHEVITQTAQKLHLAPSDLKEYLQIHYKAFETQENPITHISPWLDTQELFFQISQKSDAVVAAIKSKENFLLNDKKIVDDLKKLAYKNYVCIVHADGDNMSRVIEDKTKIHEVSKSLFDYCLDSHKAIKNFGGQTIFAGGDDLLFFAPVVDTDSGRSIFNLCEEISTNFQERFDKKATLSFGIFIHYLKYPLYEALENSRALLFSQAKEAPKNNIAFQVTKHSGQSFGTVIHKGNKTVYENFLDFSASLQESSDTDQFLHSIHHKIDLYSKIIEETNGDKEKLTNFFDNYFNEEEHKKYEDFFENLINFMEAVYEDESIKNRQQLIYATLRFVKFIKGDKT